MSEDYFVEASRDAKILAKRISPGDYERLRTHWQNRDFTFIAFMLRRYGIEFKGLTYLETLIEELGKMKEGGKKEAF